MFEFVDLGLWGTVSCCVQISNFSLFYLVFKNDHADFPEDANSNDKHKNDALKI